MVNSKRYLRIPDACKQPEMPWTPEELRRRIHNAKPRFNSRKELIPGTGDEQFLKIIIQEGYKTSIWVDMHEVQNYLDAHRLTSRVET